MRQDWAKIEKRKFAYPVADFNKKTLLYAQYYMAKSGRPGYDHLKYEEALPEELRALL